MLNPVLLRPSLTLIEVRTKKLMVSRVRNINETIYVVYE